MVRLRALRTRFGLKPTSPKTKGRQKAQKRNATSGRILRVGFAHYLSSVGKAFSTYPPVSQNLACLKTGILDELFEFQSGLKFFFASGWINDEKGMYTFCVRFFDCVESISGP